MRHGHTSTLYCVLLVSTLRAWVLTVGLLLSSPAIPVYSQAKPSLPVQDLLQEGQDVALNISKDIQAGMPKKVGHRTQMTIAEKELVITKSGFPVSEVLQIKQRERDSALERAECDVERELVAREYVGCC